MAPQASSQEPLHGPRPKAPAGTEGGREGPAQADLADIIREHGDEEARRRNREMGETAPRVHGGPARVHQPRTDIPDDSIEMESPGARESRRAAAPHEGSSYPSGQCCPNHTTARPFLERNPGQTVTARG